MSGYLAPQPLYFWRHWMRQSWFRLKRYSSLYTGPEGSRKLRLPEFLDNRHMKVIRLSAPHTSRLYPPGNILGTHCCWRLSRPQGRSVVERIVAKINSNDTIRNRTRDLPACSAVSQPNAPPLTPCWSRRS
jgi:hypothetical protein